MTKRTLIQSRLSSWRTTSTGIVALLGAVGMIITAAVNQFDGDPDTVPAWNLAIEAIVAAAVGLGLISARDNSVTSEEAGAHKPQH